jgi:hypothetical protein
MFFNETFTYLFGYIVSKTHGQNLVFYLIFLNFIEQYTFRNLIHHKANTLV